MVVITPDAYDLIQKAEQNPLEFIEFHTRLDKGELSQDDYERNLEALKTGDRIFSCFLTEAGNKVYVITESDRSVTTILTPDDY